MAGHLTRTAAVALAALACGLGAAACGGDGTSKEQEAADRRAEARWVAGLTRWSSDMLGALNGISVLLGRAESVTRLQRGEARTSAQLERFEQTLAGCTAAIARRGPPPDALRGVRQEALRACRNLERGARLVRNGVAVWQDGGGIGALDSAYYALGSGQRGVARVRTKLKAALDG